MTLYKRNVPLKWANRFRVGGACDIFFSPQHSQALIDFLQQQACPPFFVLGAGSNVLIRDGGFRGACIQLGAPFSYIQRIDEGCLRVGAATLNSAVAHFCAEHGLDGLTFLSGIPGRVGGALYMNAGCYGQEIKDAVKSITGVDKKGTMHTFPSEEIPWGYRTCGLEEGFIFLEVVFLVQLSTRETVQQKIDYLQEKRQKTQPIFEKTAGSTFKNFHDKKAWELIDTAGCRSWRVGDVALSSLHCNFLINLGSACAQDIETLGEKVRQRVFEVHQRWLEWEIKIIGEKI